MTDLTPDQYKQIGELIELSKIKICPSKVGTTEFNRTQENMYARELGHEICGIVAESSPKRIEGESAEQYLMRMRLKRFINANPELLTNATD